MSASPEGKSPEGGIPFALGPEPPLLVVLSGPSGAGKTTFCRALLDANVDLRLSISATTRPRREGERDGEDYYFLTPAEFERREAAGEFLETARVHQHRYGTPRSAVEKALQRGESVLLNVDVQGGRSIRKAFPDGVYIFLLPPSLAALKERLLRRGQDTEAVVDERLKVAPGEIAQLVEYDYIVVNQEFDAALARIQAILLAEKSRTRRRLPAKGTDRRDG